MYSLVSRIILKSISGISHVKTRSSHVRTTMCIARVNITKLGGDVTIRQQAP